MNSNFRGKVTVHIVFILIEQGCDGVNVERISTKTYKLFCLERSIV